MRTNYAIKNVFVSIMVEVLVAISGIILPRFFIETYGSSVNGLVSSIGQFITYMGLVEAGVSAAATVDLYKPLAIHDELSINNIVTAVKRFYYKSGILFALLDLMLIIGYPFIVKNEIADVSFIRMMIVVLSLNGIVDYFVLGKYRVLLIADQKTYIIGIAQCAGTIITLFVSIWLIEINASPILVKGVVAVVYLLRTLVIIVYSKMTYRFLDFNSSERADNVFEQRNSALFHQVVGMICNNTDIVLLTIMLKNSALVEVSIYATYNMVAANISSLFNSISNGIRASFGQLMAEGDSKALENSFSIFEIAYYIFLFIIYTCMGVLLYSFISLYSNVFPDKNLYVRWILVALFTACGIVQNIRIPGYTIQIAAGHFKQTQGAALLEAIINFGVSITLVTTMGISGVLIGTLCAYLFRSSYVIWYNNKVFLNHTLKRTISRIVRNLIAFAIISFLSIKYITTHINSWYAWIGYAIIMVMISTIVYFSVNYIFEPSVVRTGFDKVKEVWRRKRE